MYNGIGLQTARGSGTNGFVQRNMAFIKGKKEKPMEYNSEGDLARLERSLHKNPNKELMEHNWKRKIELQCLELQEKMENDGCEDDEVDKEVNKLRDKLLSEGYQSLPGMMDSHHLAMETEKRNENIRKAFGISKDYVGGSAFDFLQQQEKAAERKAAREEREAEKERLKMEEAQ
jgi:serine/arginine repetitive matrix protein 2